MSTSTASSLTPTPRSRPLSPLPRPPWVRSRRGGRRGGGHLGRRGRHRHRALFPFALPLILLTAAALVPLLLVGLAVGAVAALAAAPLLLARRLLRASRESRPPEPGARSRARLSRAACPL